jgi:hypothetical protein
VGARGDPLTQYQSRNPAFVLDPDGHNIEAVCFGKGE